MTPIGIHDRVVAMMPRSDAPEAVSVLVVGTNDPATIKAVAPMVAKALYPDRWFGDVLHVEWSTDGWQVAVEAIGRPLSAVNWSSGNGR